MVSIDVFRKADALTPARFWGYALRTVAKYAREYDSLGYEYSEKDTLQYRAMSEEEKSKVRFDYIDGVKQY